MYGTQQCFLLQQKKMFYFCYFCSKKNFSATKSKKIKILFWGEGEAGELFRQSCFVFSSMVKFLVLFSSAFTFKWFLLVNLKSSFLKSKKQLFGWLKNECIKKKMFLPFFCKLRRFHTLGWFFVVFIPYLISYFNSQND